MLEKVDPGDGGTFASTGLSCWCWLEFAGTGGEGSAAHGKYSVLFDTILRSVALLVSLHLVVWLSLGISTCWTTLRYNLLLTE